MALGQSDNSPSATDETLKDVGKYMYHMTPTGTLTLTVRGPS